MQYYAIRNTFTKAKPYVITESDFDDVLDKAEICCYCSLTDGNYYRVESINDHSTYECYLISEDKAMDLYNDEVKNPNMSFVGWLQNNLDALDPIFFTKIDL